MRQYAQDGRPKNRAKGMTCICDPLMSYSENGRDCTTCGLRRTDIVEMPERAVPTMADRQSAASRFNKGVGKN